MSKYFGIGVGVVALCLALLGCGGDGGVSHSAHGQLQEALDDALMAHEAEEAARAEAEADAAAEKAAREEAEAEAAKQQRRADAAVAAEQEAQRQRDAAQEQIQEAEEEAEQAQQSAREAEERAAEVERTREASQRAQYLQAEMLSLDVPVPVGTDITMNVPSRGRLEFRRPGTSWRPATLGGSGLRNTTMPLTSAVNTGKTVVYTDRELSRPLLEHFGFLRDPNNPNLLEFTTGALTFAAVDADGESTDGVVDTSVGGMDMWKLTLPRGSLPDGIPKTVPGTPDTNTPPNYSEPPGLETARTDDSYPVSLFGMSGQLVCPGCDVTLTPTYANAVDENGRYVLESVAVGGANLRFDPSGSPSVHFYNGSDFLGDYEYMVFGYWREDPKSPASPYDDGSIGVFAKAFDGTGSLAVPGTINATYRGVAVGMYVEQELSDPIDTHRQGEFVANAILTVAGVPDDITGTIRDFAVTPTGGSALPHRFERWVVRLLDQSGANPIVLNNESGTTTGGWVHEYVRAHEYAGRDSDHTTNRDTPTGVTGTFNARIGTISRTPQHVDDIDMDALHIIGAFGAHQ